MQISGYSSAAMLAYRSSGMKQKAGTVKMQDFSQMVQNTSAQATSQTDKTAATKEVSEVDEMAAFKQEIYEELKKGRSKEQVTDAFDGPGMLLTGVLVRCMEMEGVALGVETGADQILENLLKRYRPHKDKGNFNTRIRQMQTAYEETLEVFATKDLQQKENKNV